MSTARWRLEVAEAVCDGGAGLKEAADALHNGHSADLRVTLYEGDDVPDKKAAADALNREWEGVELYAHMFPEEKAAIDDCLEWIRPKAVWLPKLDRLEVFIEASTGSKRRTRLTERRIDLIAEYVSAQMSDGFGETLRVVPLDDQGTRWVLAG